MLITDRLNDDAHNYRDEIALVEREPQYNQRRVMTWQEFEDQSNRVARGLMASGLKKGDRAAILMTNCLGWLPISTFKIYSWRSASMGSRSDALRAG